MQIIGVEMPREMATWKMISILVIGKEVMGMRGVCNWFRIIPSNCIWDLGAGSTTRVNSFITHEGQNVLS
jgi:hypothetical protein